MKKVYFKPEVLVVDAIAVSMLAQSGGNINPPGTKPPFIKSNENRGEWGNVWK